ncbi:protein ZBED8-like, partial [Homarus americanus]|uniref:protein ZBED8-like n=1 Tax=Homarus americanus TaxID=6706 RepID=UPI001C45B34B
EHNSLCNLVKCSPTNVIVHLAPAICVASDLFNFAVLHLLSRKKLDESTVRDSEALLMAYVRYVDNGEFIEDMLFCEALETTTIAIDKYKKLKTYLDDKQIPMENIISCDDGEFLDDKPYMTLLLTVDGKALVSYLADIFEKLNVLNKELQGTNMTLVNSKAKIFGFISFLELSQENISVKKFEQFYWLNKCEVTDATCLVIVEHLKIMVSDFNFRFSDLKEINYPSWMTQPLLVDLSDVTMEYQGELSELQNDDSIKALFKIKGTMMWLCEETQAKYPNTSSLARKLLLPFPSSYLVECGFSAVNDLLLKKRN